MKTNYRIASFVFTIFFFICVISSHAKAAEESLVLYFHFDEVNEDAIDDQVDCSLYFRHTYELCTRTTLSYSE